MEIHFWVITNVIILILSQRSFSTTSCLLCCSQRTTKVGWCSRCMRHDFFDIYDEYRLTNVSVNFSYLYEEWKRRNSIYFPPVDPPLVLARPSASPGLVACCSFFGRDWDTAGHFCRVVLVPLSHKLVVRDRFFERG